MSVGYCYIIGNYNKGVGRRDGVEGLPLNQIGFFVWLFFFVCFLVKKINVNRKVTKILSFVIICTCSLVISHLVGYNHQLGYVGSGLTSRGSGERKMAEPLRCCCPAENIGQQRKRKLLPSPWHAAPNPPHNQSQSSASFYPREHSTQLWGRGSRESRGCKASFIPSWCSVALEMSTFPLSFVFTKIASWVQFLSWRPSQNWEAVMSSTGSIKIGN